MIIDNFIIDFIIILVIVSMIMRINVVIMTMIMMVTESNFITLQHYDTYNREIMFILHIIKDLNNHNINVLIMKI